MEINLMKKSLQCLIFMISIILPTMTSASVRLKRLTKENLKRRADREQKYSLDMRNQDQKKAALKATIAQKILVEILKIDLNSQEYKDTRYPPYSPQGPIDSKKIVTNKQKMAQEMATLMAATTVRSLLFDEDPIIKGSCQKQSRSTNVVSQKIDGAEAFKNATLDDFKNHQLLLVQTASSPTSITCNLSPYHTPITRKSINS